MKIALFLDIIGVVKPSPSMGFRCPVSGFSPALAFSLLTPYTKLHIVVTANRRISNIGPQNVEGWNRFAQSFLK